MRPATGVIGGSGLILAGLATALVWVPAAIADAASYSQAPACTEPAVSATNCWTDAPAVVRATRVVHHRRYDEWIVDLSSDYGRWQAAVAHRASFNQLAAGSQVTARLWRSRVVLIRPAGLEALPTEADPAHQLGIALLVTAFVLLAGAVFVLGAIGVHRRYGSWTRSVDRGEWGADLYYGLPTQVQHWGAALMTMTALAIGGAVLSWLIFGADLLSGAAIGAGFGALAWAWSLHHRARTRGAA